MAERNQTVDALRAIAALWVCLFHFTSATGVGRYGYLGVTIFFVISGFIVPWSMARADTAKQIRLAARIGYRTARSESPLLAPPPVPSPRLRRLREEG